MSVKFFAHINIVYCFHDKDREFCDALDGHLASLKQNNRIYTWDKRQMRIGKVVEDEYTEHFATAHLFLLFISSDFLAEETWQMQKALDKPGAVVIPVLVRYCRWQETQLADLLPKGSRPLSDVNLDKACEEIVEKIVYELDREWPVVYVIAATADINLVKDLSEDMRLSGVIVCYQEGHLLQQEGQARNAMRQASAIILIVSPATESSAVVRNQMALIAYYNHPIQVVRTVERNGAWFYSETWRIENEWDVHAPSYEAVIKDLLAFVLYSITQETQPVIGRRPTGQETQPVTGHNPYKGLMPFTENDTHDFFGRDALINNLAEAVEAMLVEEKRGQESRRLLTVLGASGSGKSSVIRAGLLPQLQQGGVFNSREWIYLDRIVPGDHPLKALEDLLVQQPSLGNATSLNLQPSSDSLKALHLLACKIADSSLQKVVLFIDQFEEVFTLTESEEERQHFFNLLITAMTVSQGPLLVVLTLRADFYDRSMQYPDLYPLLEAHCVSVLPMKRDELRQVIEGPAGLPNVQVTFEGDLVGDLLFDMHEQGGALPLLEFTLDQLFTHKWRHGQMLTLQAYHEIGGVKGALEKHAEATYEALPTKEHQELTKGLFLRLINPGRTEKDTTRRPAPRSEFELHNWKQKRLLRETIDAFIAARLLTTNKHLNVATIEVSHEALIREWQRLIKWLENAREDISLQQKISQDAEKWQLHRPNDRLYRGSQFKEARVWAKRNTPSELEGKFLRASMKHRVQRFITNIMISIVLVFVTTTGTVAWFLIHQPSQTVVTKLSNDGVGSLRWVIDSAPSGGKPITFAPSLAGQTIRLTSALLIPNKKLQIQGPSTGKPLTINNPKDGIEVDTGAEITMSHLRFIGGPSNSEALLNNFGKLILIDSIISNNTTCGSFGVGGGIFNFGVLTVTDNSIVSNNTASGTSGGDGGGIFNDGTLMLNDSTISGNIASGASSSGVDGGGGIFNLNGKLTLNDSTISNNKTSGTSAASCTPVTPDTPDSDGGGGIFSYGGILNLTNSTISGNTASGNLGGGGIFSYTGILNLTNSTISANIASIAFSGGIENFGGTASFVFCTIYNNTAYNSTTKKRGDLSTEDIIPSNSTIRNSLIADDQASNDPDIGGNLTTEGYNLIQNTTGITTLLDPDHKQDTDLTNIPLSDIKIDSMLKQKVGEKTMTYALGLGSRAIDAIPLAACSISVNGITTDQRGVKRPQGSACDIGAYEYVS